MLILISKIQIDQDYLFKYYLNKYSFFACIMYKILIWKKASKRRIE